VYRGVIVTKAIENATTLADALRGTLTPTGRAAVLDAVARSVRAMHERGVHHRDLNSANILLTGAGADVAVHLIDFDRAQIRRELPHRVRRRALRRLDRSLAKLNSEREVISLAERVYLARAYWTLV
jgi:tRNA A-37 threonylcarbamoyl transferase component Bud32